MPSILRLLILVNSLQNRFKENGAKIPVPKENLERKGEMKLKSCMVVKRALFQQSTLDQLDRGKPINTKRTVAYGLKKNVFIKSRYGPCVTNDVNTL